MLHFRSPNIETDPAPWDGLSGDAVHSQVSGRARAGFTDTGIAPSMMIETDRGAVRAGDLKAGDLLVTRGGGLRPLCWSMTSRGGTGAGPAVIRLPSDRLGKRLIVGEGQGVLISHPANVARFGRDEVVVTARDLLHLPGATRLVRRSQAWVHLLLDSHELIRAQGRWVESFAPQLARMRATSPEVWDDLSEAMPRLRFDTGEAAYQPSWLRLDPREARAITAL